MSYISEWIAVLAKFKTNTLLLLNESNNATSKSFNDAKYDFITFVHGHSVILKDNSYDREVIEIFNQILSNENPTITSESDMNKGLLKLIKSIDNAIYHNKDENKMTTNYTINGNPQIGDNNSQTNTQNTTDININLQTLINEIEKSGDEEAKNKLLEFLNNGTIAGIIGVTASEIAKFLGQI